ncbi:hypothetical protein [Candidatus Avelusimicrobium alvi]|uniref:hypothetical protein n=1 Tax=Candidatus Avelusimicrobium alvi TaxID=3416221 RepID=UPI003D1133C6
MVRVAYAGNIFPHLGIFAPTLALNTWQYTAAKLTAPICRKSGKTAEADAGFSLLRTALEPAAFVSSDLRTRTKEKSLVRVAYAGNISPHLGIFAPTLALNTWQYTAAKLTAPICRKSGKTAEADAGFSLPRTALEPAAFVSSDLRTRTKEKIFGPRCLCGQHFSTFGHLRADFGLPYL